MLNSQHSTESGFTIIESLLAIIVVGILLVSIAPVLVLSTATRVQARRVELATQAGRTYVDGVRAGAIALPNSVVILPQFDSTKPNTLPTTSFATVLGPPSTRLTACQPPLGVRPIPTNFYCPPAPALASPPILATTTTNLFCMNLDGKPQGCSTRSSNSFIIQAFRSATDLSDTGDKGYILAIRVYRADGFDGLGGRLNTTEKRTRLKVLPKVATYTGGGGDRRSPLVEVVTEVRGVNASDNTNLDNMKQRLGGSNPNFPR